MSLTVTSIEVEGGVVPLSVDAQSSVPVYITMRGTDMQSVTSVELDSGADVAWVIGGFSAGSTSVLVTAYAYGTSPGPGFIQASLNAQEAALLGDIGFEFPLLD